MPADAAEVVAPGATLEKLWGEGSFTEGGRWPATARSCSPTSATGSCGSTRRPASVTVFREPSGRANGLIFDAQGRLIAAEGANTGGGRRVSITERDGTVRTLADRYEGKRFNSPNDVAVDRRRAGLCLRPPLRRRRAPRARLRGGLPDRPRRHGRPPRDDRRQAQRPGRQPRRHDALRLRQRPQAARAPGAGPRPDTGAVSHPRVLHDFGDGRGIDGMTVTTDGRIVAAAGSGAEAGVYVFAPDGRRLAFIPTPEDPDQRRVRRRRRQDALHHRRQEPLPDRHDHDRLPPVAAAGVKRMTGGSLALQPDSR